MLYSVWWFLGVYTGFIGSFVPLPCGPPCFTMGGPVAGPPTTIFTSTTKNLHVTGDPWRASVTWGRVSRAGGQGATGGVPGCEVVCRFYRSLTIYGYDIGGLIGLYHLFK